MLELITYSLGPLLMKTMVSLLLSSGMSRSPAAIFIRPGSARNVSWLFSDVQWLYAAGQAALQSIPGAELWDGPPPPAPQVGIISYIPIKPWPSTTWENLQGKWGFIKARGPPWQNRTANKSSMAFLSLVKLSIFPESFLSLLLMLISISTGASLFG